MGELPPEIVELGNSIRDLKEQLKSSGMSNKEISKNDLYKDLTEQLDTMKVEAGFDPKTNKPLLNALTGALPPRAGTPKGSRPASDRVIDELMLVCDLLEEAVVGVREGHARLQRERTEVQEQTEEATRAIEEAEATREVLLRKLGR